MSFQNSGYLVEEANDRDSEGIRDVFLSGSFDGDIVLQYLRDPNPVAAFAKEAYRSVLLVMKDTKENNRIIGVGGCLLRKVYLNGEIKTAGYLTGLKLLPAYQKKIRFIPKIYQYLYELTRNEADVYYTTILSGNTEVQKMLEKPRKSMPRYDYQEEYTVFCCKAGLTVKKNPLFKKCRINEVEGFILAQNRHRDLSLAGLDAYGLEDAQWYALYDTAGEIRAAGYVLNQQSYKQYVVRRYKGVYRLAAHFPTRMLGYPSFPRAGRTVNYASANIWVCKQDIAAAKALWKQMLAASKGYDFLMLGLFLSNPLYGVLRKGKHVSYRSRCYEVVWDHERPRREFSGLNLDVSLL